jgi:multicomponent Na+:H+ antiporter subunit E
LKFYDKGWFQTTFASIIGINNLFNMHSSTITASKFLYNWLLMFVVWIGFTTSFQIPELLTGAIVSLIVVLITAKYFSCCGLDILLPNKLFFIAKYFVVFIIALFKANFDVARRVVSPSLPINPGIVEFETKLTNEFAKMVLANSITLTPGTLSVDMVGNRFFIHWIDVVSEDQQEAHRLIAKDFEDILIKIFN